MRILRSSFIEVSSIEPTLYLAFYFWPLVVENRIPRCITVLSLEDEVVVEDALEPEPQSEGRISGALIEGVAAPLHPAISKAGHGVAQHQKECLRGTSRSLKFRAEPDMPNLDHAILWVDVEEARLATGPSAIQRTNRIKHRIKTCGL